jgi:hypothetical protein
MDIQLSFTELQPFFGGVGVAGAFTGAHVVARVTINGVVDSVNLFVDPFAELTLILS